MAGLGEIGHDKAVEVCYGLAGAGRIGLGLAGRSRTGMRRRDLAWRSRLDMAWRGPARHGWAWPGGDCDGKAVEAGRDWACSGRSGHGPARPDKAGLGGCGGLRRGKPRPDVV
jgi:hypothetical protein